MKTINKLPKLQMGISLIEIMVALLIGLFLLGGLMQIFLESRNTYKMQSATARVQDNGRFALDLMTQDIRNADYLGCLPRSRKYDGHITKETTLGSIKVGVSGVDNDNVSTNEIKNGTDSIRFGGVYGVGAPVVIPSDDPIVSVKIATANTFKTNDVAMLVDCESAEIFKITSVGSAGTSPASTAIGHAPFASTKGYDMTAQAFLFYDTSYYIGTALNNTTATPSLFSLYRKDNTTGSKQEMIEGVENMQIVYGSDTDGDKVANYYVPLSCLPRIADPDNSLNQIPDTTNVVSIRINLLVASLEDGVNSKAVPYIYNTTGTCPSGSVCQSATVVVPSASPSTTPATCTTTQPVIPVTPTDYRRRAIYTTTVAVRNQLI